MNALAQLIPATARKWLYAITAAVNAIGLIVIPLLVTLNVIPTSAADQISMIVGAVLAIVSGLVATGNVPASGDNTDA
jgi:hypothetical protein